jgi:hypothetical protein
VGAPAAAIAKSTPTAAVTASAAPAPSTGRHLTADNGVLAADTSRSAASRSHVLQHRRVLQHVRQDKEPKQTAD